MNRFPLVFATITLAACTAPRAQELATNDGRSRGAAQAVAVLDSTIDATLEASGVAAPFAQATVSTKLMGTVTDVLVREGDRVSTGQPLARIDARDVDARHAQAAAGLAAAEAALANATTQAKRLRALFADSAAPKAQLDDAETGLAQADAATRAARAQVGEVESMRDYATVRAPFNGVITHRFVDPGAFAAPGAPLLAIQDGSRLRLTVSAAPAAARGLRRGRQLPGTVDGRPVRATVEGVVPSAAGGVYTINAIVPNAGGTFGAGTSATLDIPVGRRQALLVPAGALVREGDLVGVRVRTGSGDDLRWVKIGLRVGVFVEILSGVRAGEQVLVPHGTGA